MKYIDSHSHWTDLKWGLQGEGLALQLKECLEKKIDFFLLGGVDPDEWLRQIELKTKYPDNFGLCFGLIFSILRTIREILIEIKNEGQK